MTRALLATALVAALGGAAHAAPWLHAPDGWHADAEQATAIGKEAGQVSHFGSGRAIAAAQVYAPAERGVVLNAIMITAATPADVGAAARAEVDDLHATSHRAALAGSGVAEDGWREHVDAAAKQIEADLEWHDPSSGTHEVERLVIAADKTTIVALTGECIAADDAAPALVAQCRAALATLDPGVDPARRIALSLAPAGNGSPPVAASPSMKPGGHQLSHTPLAPITVPKEAPTTDRRPVYVGLGLVVIAALFWWNRRRRDRLEKGPRPE